jgi:light-regulated signal transduction histidine kinase (bacteriophytochrome)
VRMQELINALLTYSRVNVQVSNDELIDLNDIFNKVIMNLKISIMENNVKLTKDHLPTVKADAVLFMQVFQNLISNAIKFKSEKFPQIHIGVERKKKEWLFSIKDNGIGFEKHNAERIFQIFQRLHRNEEYKGAGIGLAICKKIITRFNGKIWAVSEPQKGSVFYFTIPF